VRDPPLLGFLLPRTQRRRVPRFTALRRDAARWTRDRRSLAGAVLRVLAPLDGSGCTSRRSVPLARHAVGRDAPTLGGPVSCRSRSWSRPSELFPSRGAVPALAGLLLPCGFAFDRCPTRRARGFHDRFPRRADLFAAARPRGLTGRRSRDGVSSRPLRQPVARAAKRADCDRQTSCTPGSPVGGRHAHFEALLPPRVPARVEPSLGQGEIDGPVLSWASSPLELAPARFRVRLRRRGTRKARVEPALPCISKDRSPASFARSRPRSRAHAPGIRRRTRSIEPRAPPTGSDRS